MHCCSHCCLSQAFLLGAMKFHCYVRALPAAPAPGTAVLLDAILSGALRGWLGAAACLQSRCQSKWHVAG